MKNCNVMLYVLLCNNAKYIIFKSSKKKTYTTKDIRSKQTEQFK